MTLSYLEFQFCCLLFPFLFLAKTPVLAFVYPFSQIVKGILASIGSVSTAMHLDKLSTWCGWGNCLRYLILLVISAVVLISVQLFDGFFFWKVRQHLEMLTSWWYSMWCNRIDIGFTGAAVDLQWYKWGAICTEEYDCMNCLSFMSICERNITLHSSNTCRHNVGFHLLYKSVSIEDSLIVKFAV